jgi:major capsid protein E
MGLTNTFFTDEHTAVLQKLIRQVVNDPKTYRGSKYIPSVVVPQRRIRTEVWVATGGITNEHTVGTDPKIVSEGQFFVQEFEPPAYKESILFDEKRLLYLRELGMNDPSHRGIRQYIELNTDRLNRRLEARMEYNRWQAIFTGGFTYLGKQFSYGFTAANNVAPASNAWGTFISNVFTVNNSADPLADMRYWIMGGYAPFRKYKITKILMNPNTARVLLDNTNVQSFIKTYFSAENFGVYDPVKVLAMAVPGLPPVEVYDGWYQSETINTQTGAITVTDAKYFIPDGGIFFEASLPGGDQIGEFVQGISLASGSIDSPGAGKFLVVDDNTAPGTRGGPSNPFILLTAGVYGGVKMDRPFDVLTANVATTGSNAAMAGTNTNSPYLAPGEANEP